MKSFEKLPTIPNVAAGNTITIKLPINALYEKVMLRLTDVTAAQLTNIKLEANSRTISEWPNGQYVLDIDSHYDRYKKAGWLVFNLTRPELDISEKRRFFGLDTSSGQGIQSAQFIMDIAADAGANCKIEAFAEKSQPVAGVPNWLTKVRRYQAPVTSIGQFEIDNIPRPKGSSIAAIHLFFPDGADGDSLAEITKAELLVNNVNWHSADAQAAHAIQELYGRTPTTDKSTVIDLILDGDVSHALPINQTVQDLRLRCEAASTGNVIIMVEYIDMWGADRF